MNWQRHWRNCALVLALILGISPGYGVRRADAADEKAATPASEGEHAKTNEVVDPLVVNLDLAIFSFLVFVGLAVVLKKFAWKPILQALEKRESSIADHIAQAERSNADAKRLLADYEAKLTAAASEVRALMEEARRDAEHAKQEILTEAKAGADAERNRALRDIESATDSAMETLAERSAQLAVDLAGKILQSKLNAGDHAKLIQDAMSKFPATASRN